MHYEMVNSHYWDLSGKKAVVTGASRGIGREIAISLAKSGADVIVNYLNNEKCAFEVKEIIQQFGRKCECIKSDVSNVIGVSKLLETAEKCFGSINIWVNNVGQYKPALLIHTTEEQWNKTITVNLKSCFWGTKLAVKSMLKFGIPGCIINIASYAANDPEAYGSVYAAAKAGVIALSKVAAKEYGPWGIRVNSIAPGVVFTDMSKEFLNTEQMMENCISAKHIGSLSCFLASDKAEYITGKVFSVTKK